MRYAVLGTGMVGRTVAAKLLDLGHEVAVGTRSPEDTMKRTEPDASGTVPYTQWQDTHHRARLETFADAVAFGERVVNATSGGVSLDALHAAGAPNLDGKILVDIANPLVFSQGMPPALDPVNTDSLGERIQRTFPGAKVVKTLNTMNCRVMVDPGRVKGEHNVFVSGDDAGAKRAVIGLLTSFGWSEQDVVDLGDITTARGAEMLLPIWLRLWGVIGHTDFNFHIQGARSGAS
ncbi:NADPH-dependent F420 reductase [Streptomyces sp. NPDC002004]